MRAGLRVFAAGAAVVLGVAGWWRADRRAADLLHAVDGRAGTLDDAERATAYGLAFGALEAAVAEFADDGDQAALLRRADAATAELHATLSRRTS